MEYEEEGRLCWTVFFKARSNEDYWRKQIIWRYPLYFYVVCMYISLSSTYNSLIFRQNYPTGSFLPS